MKLPHIPHYAALSRMIRGILIALILLLTGCGPEAVEWHGKDISKLMPELEYRLTDENGREVTAAEYDGQLRLLFFGFTSCPDICPATLAHLRNAIKKVPEDLQDDIQVLFVSVDPERDSPEALAEYTGYFGPQFVGMTAPEDKLRALSQRYRSTFGYGEPDADGHYDVSHSNAIYVFDRQGAARLLIRAELTPDQIAEDMTQILEESA